MSIPAHRPLSRRHTLVLPFLGGLAGAPRAVAQGSGPGEDPGGEPVGSPGGIQGAGPGGAAGWPRTVTDVLDRRVTLSRPPRAVLLAEGFQLLTLSMAHPDPVPLLVGRGGDLARLDATLDAAWRRRFPALGELPEITSAVGQGFSLERALSLGPDLVVLSAWQMASADMRQNVERLDAAGVPVVVVDTFLTPLRNYLPSVRLLGQVFGQEERAERYAALAESRIGTIRDRLRDAPDKRVPAVLLNSFPVRWDCCWAAGTIGGGEILTLLNARNVAVPFLPGPRGGAINLEQVLLSAPEVYVGTGIRDDAGDRKGIQLGTGVAAAEARDSLRAVMASPGFRDLPEAARRDAHGIWNPVFGSPVGIAVVEAIARWLHPALFRDLDPVATLAGINQSFALVPFEGTYWTSLEQG